MAFNSKNPFLNNKSFTTSLSKKDEVHQAVLIDDDQSMTIGGTINKSFILFLLLTASAAAI
ncbi:MAG TPA: hypothetical protein VK476_07260, partial [Flavobacterium sp.]|nr:hypothetical protein [Flavobacterium sp.]